MANIGKYKQTLGTNKEQLIICRIKKCKAKVMK